MSFSHQQEEKKQDLATLTYVFDDNEDKLQSAIKSRADSSACHWERVGYLFYSHKTLYLEYYRYTKGYRNIRGIEVRLTNTLDVIKDYCSVYSSLMEYIKENDIELIVRDRNRDQFIFMDREQLIPLINLKSIKANIPHLQLTEQLFFHETPPEVKNDETPYFWLAASKKEKADPYDTRHFSFYYKEHNKEVVEYPLEYDPHKHDFLFCSIDPKKEILRMNLPEFMADMTKKRCKPLYDPVKEKRVHANLQGQQNDLQKKTNDLAASREITRDVQKEEKTAQLFADSLQSAYLLLDQQSIADPLHFDGMTDAKLAELAMTIEDKLNKINNETKAINEAEKNVIDLHKRAATLPDKTQRLCDPIERFREVINDSLLMQHEKAVYIQEADQLKEETESELRLQKINGEKIEKLTNRYAQLKTQSNQISEALAAQLHSVKEAQYLLHALDDSHTKMQSEIKSCNDYLAKMLDNYKIMRSQDDKQNPVKLEQKKHTFFKKEEKKEMGVSQDLSKDEIKALDSAKALYQNQLNKLLPLLKDAKQQLERARLLSRKNPTLTVLQQEMDECDKTFKLLLKIFNQIHTSYSKIIGKKALDFHQEIPAVLKDPLSPHEALLNQMIIDPVIVSSGNTYDKWTLEVWFLTNPINYTESGQFDPKDPLTGLRLNTMRSQLMLPNHVVSDALDAFIHSKQPLMAPSCTISEAPFMLPYLLLASAQTYEMAHISRYLTMYYERALARDPNTGIALETRVNGSEYKRSQDLEMVPNLAAKSLSNLGLLNALEKYKKEYPNEVKMKLSEMQLKYKVDVEDYLIRMSKIKTMQDRAEIKDEFEAKYNAAWHLALEDADRVKEINMNDPSAYAPYLIEYPEFKAQEKEIRDCAAELEKLQRMHAPVYINHERYDRNRLLLLIGNAQNHIHTLQQGLKESLIGGQFKKLLEVVHDSPVVELAEFFDRLAEKLAIKNAHQQRSLFQRLF